MVPRSSVRTCRDAPSPSPRLDISANVLSPCHKRCRYRFRCIFFRWPGSRVHSAERSGAPSGAESKMNADSCAKRKKEKKKPRPKTRCSTPKCDRRVPPSRCPPIAPAPPKCFSPPPPPPLRNRLSGSRNGVILCCSEGRVGAVRCRQQEHHAAVPGEARRGPRVARRIYQPPHNLKDKCIDPAFVQDHLMMEVALCFVCLFFWSC